uniref:Uncharacterized protein n=1 Tax=Paramoeba aestuarina TaxID=180227 RepID=A0A7S4P5A3_9EUKA|mmetsp:Transcript_36351/g.56961  ORF Transcript_36351/g.56961 Transcript_36351/m.56961 type:complete len:404 (+) Transcript_36351:46-1257(+)|eukprot:CAMPEP_0201524340 /NCGR_PEP_ID=MMETSP0161_2-20130828/21257_1 /ASSEMBLY_ACC=CAM_ASM_000251 /TAXON_ID=180227 /ORGANISM="Neoparamoeba aestuarina, Strain SoJaBio B1-5/56/2" /LENGTH=403 /DNA_ID=CAMNT_0047923673 /DNA_START=46 /DNA_END=1257 /DNA_ORIENTATION=-
MSRRGQKEPRVYTRTDMLSVGPHWGREAKERARYIWSGVPTEGFPKDDPKITYREKQEKQEKGEKKEKKYVDASLKGRINDIFLTFLLGVSDKDCPLHVFHGKSEILVKIFDYVKKYWTAHIQEGDVYAALVGRVTFPKPRGININMMPILMGVTESIPKEYHHYLPLLAACPISRNEWGQVGYLTIHESEVEDEGQSQRRGGIHTECPGFILPGSHEIIDHPPLTLAWGRGIYNEDHDNSHFYGGIYMASNVSDSCQLWNAKIDVEGGVVGELGDLEHFRGVLGEGIKLEAGELAWITDRTPHESLPLKKKTKRQFFRLVTGEISVWYTKHNTPNPLGVLPGNPMSLGEDSPWWCQDQPVREVMIIDGDKFEGKDLPMCAQKKEKEKEEKEKKGFIRTILGV